MQTLLQLSDIHFRKKPDELDEYSQMMVRMIETIEDYCQNESINAILICGDIIINIAGYKIIKDHVWRRI